MAIAFDAGTNGGNVNPSTSLTFSHTCTGSNRILFVAVEGGTSGNGDIVSGVTYNTVAMTLVDKLNATTSGNRWFYLFYLIAPSTGANNVVVSTTGGSFFMSAVSASYTGAKQSGVPDATNKGGATTGTSLSVSVTTIADNCWTVAALNGAATPTGQGGTTLRGTEPTGQQTIGDSNGVITPAGSTSLGITWTGSNGNGGIIASFAPVVVAATAYPAFLMNFV